MHFDEYFHFQSSKMTAPDALAPIDQWLWNENNEISAAQLELRFRKDRNISALKHVNIYFRNYKVSNSRY